ncbi:MAG: hypothetical protein WCS94_00925 [Verrucomicrobiota bacterium]
MNRRFTMDGSDALESQLEATCEKVLTGVKALVPATMLEGILLGGGYGRGEGGVLKTAAGDQPYNDLEFYVFIRGNAILGERKFRHSLHDLGERLSPAAGLEVEFKVLTLKKLRGSAPGMFYYDLVAGHRWQLGDDALLTGCEQHHDAAQIPLHEATRLLFNRCSGLLYSLERLQRKDFGPAEADFVGRNLAKAQLAFGDVLLTAHGQYNWSCRERHARLTRLAAMENMPLAEFIRHHARGVEFKLRPTRSMETREALSARHAELSELGKKLWLWLESRRLGIKFALPSDYAVSRVNKCPETSGLRNRLVNFRASGASGLGCARYPRERLFHALVLMLWGDKDFEKIRAELRTRAEDFTGLIFAYEQLWRRFN